MYGIAIFVDAGYLYAAGSQAVSGVKQRRINLLLDVVAVMEQLMSFAKLSAPDERLLRIYWYDGVGGGKETEEQRRVAEAPNVKVRFGVINSVGEQKGVDSLIVTDLVDLAREHAIASAVVLAGDEDLRIGVEIAQRYGVRIHLLGIVPSRGNQSWLLRREADTTSEWDAETVGKFLSVFPVPSLNVASPAVAVSSTVAEASTAVLVAKGIESVADAVIVVNEDDFSSTWESVASNFAKQLSNAQAEEILAQWDAGNGVPPLYDRRLLSAAGSLIMPRPLQAEDKKALRKSLARALRGNRSQTRG